MEIKENFLQKIQIEKRASLVVKRENFGFLKFGAFQGPFKRLLEDVAVPHFREKFHIVLFECFPFLEIWFLIPLLELEPPRWLPLNWVVRALELILTKNL